MSGVKTPRAHEQTTFYAEYQNPHGLLKGIQTAKDMIRINIIFLNRLKYNNKLEKRSKSEYTTGMLSSTN